MISVPRTNGVYSLRSEKLMVNGICLINLYGTTIIKLKMVFLRPKFVTLTNSL